MHEKEQAIKEKEQVELVYFLKKTSKKIDKLRGGKEQARQEKEQARRENTNRNRKTQIEKNHKNTL